MITFTIPGEAVPWARAGGGKSVVRFTPPKQRAWGGTVKLFASQAMKGRAPLSGPLEVSICAVYQWPKSYSERRRQQPEAKWKTSRPDIGNLVKIIEDALNTVAWGDDAQICASHAWKMMGEIPRVTVRISPLVTTTSASATPSETQPGRLSA